MIKLSAASIAIASFCSMGLPQHADIKPDVEHARISTGAWIDTTSELTPDVRIFGYDFQEDPLDAYFITDPGFNTAGPSGLPVASMLGFNILDGAAFGLPANLTFWNGVGSVAFNTVPNLETLRLNLGAQNRTIGSTSGEVAGFPIGTVAAGGSVHRHLGSFLQGADGNSIPGDGNEPAAGIYLLSLELTSSDATIADSQPLFVVYNNGLSEATHDAAIEWVEANLVPIPEPATMLMCGIVALGLMVVCRHQYVPTSDDLGYDA
jgi:hypothetical protein